MAQLLLKCWLQVSVQKTGLSGQLLDPARLSNVIRRGRYTAEIFPTAYWMRKASTIRKPPRLLFVFLGSDPQHHVGLNRGEMGDGRWKINEKQDMTQGT